MNRAIWPLALAGLLFSAIAACSHADSEQANARAAEPGNAARVNLLSEIPKPGRLTVELNGAKVARTEMRDVSYCITNAPSAMGSVQLFAMVAENPAWSVSITSLARMPGAGKYPVGDEESAAYSATVTDKSTGDERAEWQRYGGSAGSVMFTDVTPNTVAGTFAIQAAPQWPQTNGPSLDVTGNFTANRTADCTTI